MTDHLSADIGTATARTSDDFRTMMRVFPTGVAIVTTTDLEGRPWGMTCSSMCSVTLTPPTLLICLRADSPTLAAIVVRGTFAVNLLHDDAQPAAELFASGDPCRFDRVTWHLDAGALGPHLQDDSLGIADCRVTKTLPIGDHEVVFGEAVGIGQTRGRSPLLYGFRRYSKWFDN